MKKRLLAIFVIALLLVTGCGKSSGKVFNDGNFKITLT